MPLHIYNRSKYRKYPKLHVEFHMPFWSRSERKFLDTYITIVNILRLKHHVCLHLIFQSMCEQKCHGTYITEVNVGTLKHKSIFHMPFQSKFERKCHGTYITRANIGITSNFMSDSIGLFSLGRNENSLAHSS